MNAIANGSFRRPVAVVGAGPVGLTAAIDLAQQGLDVVLLDEDDTRAIGSRAICFSKRTLEIFDRLGCGERMARKGIGWRVGKVYFRDRLVYAFDLLPESGYRRPAFINLQQYYVEDFLIERACELPNLDLRWKNKVVGLVQNDEGVELRVETPGGTDALFFDFVVAADGARSPIRAMMGLETKGRVFRDRFLIADVKMSADFPTERWFWFDPPFNRNQSALLHRQPDGVWRIDFQLGWEADPALEKQPERVIPRVRALLGSQIDFTLEWASVYTFSCLRMERFRHGRVIFAGDAAHGVSPFGARGANSGIQDADALGWRLRLVLEGKAPDRLLDTYDAERVFAADENILNSTRSTDFITPKSGVSRTFRNAVLELAKDHPFAQRMVNSGRLSVPSTLTESALNTPDCEPFAGAMVPGAVASDAPVRCAGRPDWLLAHIGNAFVVLYFTDGAPQDGVSAAVREFERSSIEVRLLIVTRPNAFAGSVSGITVVEDSDGLCARRYDGRPGTCYVFRPDQHVCARSRRIDAVWLRDAIDRATCAGALTLAKEVR